MQGCAGHLRGTSAGPPWLVAKVGRPQLMASTTVSPKASYSAGCTKAPCLSAQHTLSVCALILWSTLAIED